MPRLISSQRKAGLAVVFIVALCTACFLLHRTSHIGRVRVSEVSYLKSTGAPVFTIFNDSSRPILRSDRCWITSVSGDGRTNRMVGYIGYGALLASGTREVVRLSYSPTQRFWQVDFEIMQTGFAARLPLRRTIHYVRSDWIRTVKTDAQTAQTFP